MTFGFVEIHTCTSCKAAAINISNIVQYLLCNAHKNYVLVFQHINGFTNCIFMYPQTRKPRHVIGLLGDMYWCLPHQKRCTRGYLTTPYKMWMSTFTFVFSWIVCLCHKNIIFWGSEHILWTLPPTYSASYLFNQKILTYYPYQHVHNAFSCN